MGLWILEKHEPYSQGEVLGVFDSKEKARQGMNFVRDFIWGDYPTSGSEYSFTWGNNTVCYYQLPDCLNINEVIYENQRGKFDE